MTAPKVNWSETGEWCAEAADRIEALEAENEWLRAEVKAQYHRGYYDGHNAAREITGT